MALRRFLLAVRHLVSLGSTMRVYRGFAPTTCFDLDVQSAPDPCSISLGSDLSAFESECRGIKVGEIPAFKQKLREVPMDEGKVDCTLHVGMPKTGTSSIQQSLFLGLRDPRFVYFSCGEVSGAQFLPVLVRASLAKPWFWNGRGGDSTFASRMHRRYRSRFHQFLEQPRSQGKHLILSGESCSGMPQADLVGLRQLLNDQGYKVQVVVYLRPWKSWFESAYQQQIKLSTQTGPSKIPATSLENLNRLDYRSQVEALDSSFGSEHVQICVFSRNQFPNGCVVEDFCQRVGIDFETGAICRDNESIGLNAVKMLYCYKRFRQQEYLLKPLSVWQHFQMTLALREMPDTAFHFHSEYAAPILNDFASQSAWIENRINALFREDFAAFDDRPCIRTLDDFLCFDEASVKWLAQRTKSSVPKALRGEDAAKRIAEMIHRLRHQLPQWNQVSQSAGRSLRRSAVRWLYNR